MLHKINHICKFNIEYTIPGTQFLKLESKHTILGEGAYEVLNHRTTVDLFENYRNAVVICLYKYLQRNIFYQNLYFPVTVG